MDNEQAGSFRYAVGGLHQATAESVGDAWTELFRLGIRYARIAREREAQQEAVPREIATTSARNSAR